MYTLQHLQEFGIEELVDQYHEFFNRAIRYVEKKYVPVVLSVYSYSDVEQLRNYILYLKKKLYEALSQDLFDIAEFIRYRLIKAEKELKSLIYERIRFVSYLVLVNTI